MTCLVSHSVVMEAYCHAVWELLLGRKMQKILGCIAPLPTPFVTLWLELTESWWTVVEEM